MIAKLLEAETKTENVTRRLSELQRAMLDQENLLLDKFCHLLNTKKAEIRRLKRDHKLGTKVPEYQIKRSKLSSPEQDGSAMIQGVSIKDDIIVAIDQHSEIGSPASNATSRSSSDSDEEL